MAVKLHKLIITNFRVIGAKAVEIELDDIVILVGGNNFGKSTILKAYHAAVNGDKLSFDDYHNNIIIEDALPTVEIHTMCSGEDKPSEHFYTPVEDETPDTSYLIREKFTWPKKDKPPVRVGFLVTEKRFAQQKDKPRMPWANDGASRKNRPKAHLVGTFSDPQEQSDSIQSIIVDIFLEEKLRKFQPVKQNENYQSLYAQISSLKSEFIESSKIELDELAKEISTYASKIIPDHELEIIVNEKDISESNLKLFDQSEVEIKFGKAMQKFPISHHGSGARRTLLWSVLKQIAEMGYESAKKGKYTALGDYKSHLLLLDEPELSLHPSACRDTRDMLYNLAENNDNWQVMVTTHSPSFIDLTRNHTKIIRVDSNLDSVEVMTVFKPDQVSFTEDEIESLKLFNLLNPDVMEFFFGGKVLLVEGDTEYASFGKIIKDTKEIGNNIFDDLFILRCRGKVQVAMFMKILNHFKKEYFVLHDIDSKEIIKNRLLNDGKGGKKKELRIEANPAWSNNKKIETEMSVYSKVYGSIINFETAYFEESANSGKPENALAKLKDQGIYKIVNELLTGIVTSDDNLLPENTIRWEVLAEISDKFDTYAINNPEVIPRLPV